MYNPSGVFSFSPVSYTPSANFDFAGSPALTAHGSGTLDGLTGGAVVVIVPNAIGAGTLDGLTGSSSVVVTNPNQQAVFNFVSTGYTPLAHFNFGVEASGITAIGSGTLDGLTGSAVVRLIINQCVGSGTLEGLSGGAVCQFDLAVNRKTSVKSCHTLQDAVAVNHQLTANVQQADFLQLKNGLLAEEALLLIIDTAVNRQQMTLSYHDVTERKQQASSIIKRLCTAINLTEFFRSRFCLISGDTIKLHNDVLSVQDVLLFLRLLNTASQTETFEQLMNRLCALTPVSDALFKRFCNVLEQAKQPPFGKSPHIDRPRPPPIPPPSHTGTITIPTKEAYTVQHSISVVTVVGNHPIPLSKLSLSYDVDSYAWAFSGVLANKDSLSLVQMSNDEPVQLSITINGYNWKVLVESIEQSKSFGVVAINLKGRSLSALLGTPYQLQTSYTAGSDLTVQQIADSLLPFGWTIDWQCATPWLIPANGYSHTQQSVLQALATIAQNIGAVLVPSRNQQVLTMQPRYPVLPWDFNATGIDADLVIPESAIITVNTQSRTQSPINAVYVHGGENGGVLAWCRLTGTAGDVLAPTSTNNLITDVVGARALGERILAGLATQPTVSAFTMPLGGDFILAEVGQLVEVMNERAIINGVSIDVEFGKVRQNITVGEQTNNAYSKLLHLLPSQPLLVGTIAATYGDNAILTLLDGGVITARGTGTVGNNYYVRNGVIESAAPNLTLNEIVI